MIRQIFYFGFFGLRPNVALKSNLYRGKLTAEAVSQLYRKSKEIPKDSKRRDIFPNIPYIFSHH
ncbi:hypothetical protein J4434_06245, partial [Candidatus Woesearchaeota archaeon]|nr:hypothetical protein [Candidatus Woesearchaeota archaeon]